MLIKSKDEKECRDVAVARHVLGGLKPPKQNI